MRSSGVPSSFPLFVFTRNSDWLRVTQEFETRSNYYLLIIGAKILKLEWNYIFHTYITIHCATLSSVYVFSELSPNEVNVL